jgi:hypothetical protein
MIIVFSTISSAVLRAYAGDDPDLLTRVTSGLETNEDVFQLTDDPTFLDSPISYEVDDPITPTAVLKQCVIGLTSSSASIYPNETPTITVQLYQSNGSTPLAQAGVTVSLTIDDGFLSASSIITDANGTGSVTYSASKRTGSVNVTGQSTTYISGSVTFEVLTPTTPTQQNWLESNDIKPGAVGTAQLAPGVLANQSTPSFGFIQKAYIRDTYVTLIVANANSIVCDDDSFFYLNGFATGTNPMIERVNRRAGTDSVNIAGALPNDYANGVDGMTYDGKSLWVSAAGHLLQLNATLMTQTNNYTIVATGTLQGLAWDGEYLYAFVMGGATSYANKIIKVNPATGSIVASSAAEPTSDPVKNVVIDDLNLYFLHGIAANTFALLRSDLSPVGSGVIANYNIGVATFASGKVFVGGTAGIALVEASTSAILASLDTATIGDVYDIVFDGINVWAITGVAGGGGPRRFVRKISYDGGSTLAIAQSFDFTPQVPNSLAFDGQNIYVLHNDNGNVVKIFTGR